MEITEQLRQRFSEKFEKDGSGCWLWTASTAGKGYGQIKIPRERRQVYAHILSYMMHNGPIGEGQRVCHTCDNPRCVNPQHLFLGTTADNQQDMKQKGRSLYGSRNPSAKLTEKQVHQIREMLDAGVSQSRIAKAFDVHQVTVSKINRGLRWTSTK